MVRAVWNGEIIAESEKTVLVGGTPYFPPESLRPEFFRESSHTSVCSWKGEANYFDVVVKGKTNANAAWVYRDPSPAAASIRGHVAFWNGVVVEKR
jgi:uncharacterized protein (DUF427 family)